MAPGVESDATAASHAPEREPSIAGSQASPALSSSMAPLPPAHTMGTMLFAWVNFATLYTYATHIEGAHVVSEAAYRTAMQELEETNPAKLRRRVMELLLDMTPSDAPLNVPGPAMPSDDRRMPRDLALAHAALRSHVDERHRRFYASLTRSFDALDPVPFLRLFSNPPPLLLDYGRAVASVPVPDMRDESAPFLNVHQALLANRSVFPRKFTHFLGVTLFRTTADDASAKVASVWLSSDASLDTLRVPPPTVEDSSVLTDLQDEEIRKSDKTDLVFVVGETSARELLADVAAGWVVHREHRTLGESAYPLLKDLASSDVWPSPPDAATPPTHGVDTTRFGPTTAIVLDSAISVWVRHAMLRVRAAGTPQEAAQLAAAHFDAYAAYGAHAATHTVPGSNATLESSLRDMVAKMESDGLQPPFDSDKVLKQHPHYLVYPDALGHLAAHWTNGVRVVVTEQKLTSAAPPRACPSWVEATLPCNEYDFRTHMVLCGLVASYSLTGPVHAADPRSHKNDGDQMVPLWHEVLAPNSMGMWRFRHWARSVGIDTSAAGTRIASATATRAAIDTAIDTAIDMAIDTGVGTTAEASEQEPRAGCNTPSSQTRTSFKTPPPLARESTPRGLFAWPLTRPSHRPTNDDDGEDHPSVGAPPRVRHNARVVTDLTSIFNRPA